MMEVEEPLPFREELSISTLRPTLKDGSCKENLEKNDDKCDEQDETHKNFKEQASDFQKKCIELGLEQNDSSPSTSLSSKYGKSASSDASDGDSVSGKVSKSNSSSAGSCTTTSSSIEDSEEGSASETEENDELDVQSRPDSDNQKEVQVHNGTEKSRIKDDSASEKGSLEIYKPTIEMHENEKGELSYDDNKKSREKNASELPMVKVYHLEDSRDASPNLSLSTARNKSVKRKRENVEINSGLEENSHEISKSEHLVSIPRYSNGKTLRLDNEKNVALKTLDNKSKFQSNHNQNVCVNVTNSDMKNDFKKSDGVPCKSQSAYSPNSNMASQIKSVPSKAQNQSRPRQRSKLKTKNTNQHENFLDQVAAAFAEQLSGFNLGQLAPFQTSQLNMVLEKQKDSEKANNLSSSFRVGSEATCDILSNNLPLESTPVSSPTCETPNRLSIDTDDMLPIQAEVVMSDGSENGVDNVEGSEVVDEESKVNEEVDSYLQSFINCSTRGSLVEYPPLNNEVPKDGTDLTTWQLEKVSLPPFTPFVPPPSWLRFTIPAEGYKCHSCGDTFFIESSLVQHRERRSVWISLECGPCDAKLTFYNKCSFKDHIHQHAAKGEHVPVDEDAVVVRSLPLQLTKLLQPIIVPVPQSLRPMKAHNKESLAKHTKRNVSYCGGLYGKENQPKNDSVMEDGVRTTADASVTEIGTTETPSKRTVRCYLCERMFFNVRELMSHMKTNQSSSDQRVECRKCLLVLPSVCAAKAHILTHPPANSSNISVCPECGSRCDGPRDFVHHLNTCGHQYRRSGILCGQCHVCFFKFADDFINHWIKEHCSKSYECVVCSSTFESLVFHKCSSPGQQVLATFKCLLTCPLCPYVVQLHTQEEKETQDKIRGHLTDSHPSVINRVHYVYKSKFCTNAFRSKDELRAHHDREHRRDNHYRTKTCTLHHEVLGYQHQYFNGQEPRNAFITMPVTLSPEEIQEAQTRDVPTVSSVIDKTLFPDGPMTLETIKGLKAEKEKASKQLLELKEIEKQPKDLLSKKDTEIIESLKPCVCYRCGYTYTGPKDFRRHKRSCEGETAVRLCQVCGVSAVGEEFSKHCLTHIREGLIICMYCNGAPFSTQQMLQQHFKLHVHEQFSYPALCAFCSFSMPDLSMALSHLHEEHDPHSPAPTLESLDVECERCGRKFHGERGLNVHLTRCTVGTAIPMPTPAAGRQCHVCKKALTPEMFGKHIISHLEEGLLVCSLCDGLTLPSSMALLHHLEEHASTLHYPSICPMCSFRMSTPSDALTHLKEDHGFGNLSCANCEMHYTFTYQLQRHIDIVHKVCLYAKRRYICWICRAYDHVKKETLMNHFRMVHGLSMQEVDEKVMIRTRGQGTMPTSQFIPTKPLGSKELGTTKTDSKADGDSPKFKALKNSDLHQNKVKTQDTSGEIQPSSGPQKSKDDEMEINLETIVIKKELLDVINKASDSETPNLTTTFKRSKSPGESETKPDANTLNLSRDSETKDDKTLKTPIKITKRLITRNRDRKLREKTKVMIKRLPESVLSQKSRDKKEKVEENSIMKDKKKRKKKNKSFKCSFCSYSTNSKEKFNYHNAKHETNGEDDDGFVCGECGQSFVVEPSLKRHLFFAHKIKQKPHPSAKTRESPAIGKNLSGKTNHKNKSYPKLNLNQSKSNLNQQRKITIRIKNSPKPEKEKRANSEKNSDLQCCVCKEDFDSSIKLYSHLRTHGMAFLKIGRKKRSFVQERTSVKC